MPTRLVDINRLRCEYKEGLEKLLPVIAKILREGGVTEPIVARDDGTVLEGVELCTALKTMGARLAPVAESRRSIYVPLEVLGFYDDVSPSRLRVFNDTLELLYRGWPTPLVRLRSLSRGGIRVWAKLEGFNPFSGSVKDRIGWYMFRKALERGVKANLVYEATSTNTGMALAAMAAIHGLKARLYLPQGIQKASDVLLKVMGAEVIRMPKSLTVEFVDEVDRDAKKDGALHLNQFINDANFEVHLRYTAKELELQIREARIIPEAIIGGIGTSGHMSAITFYFKNRFRGSIRIYCVQPAPGNSIPGLRRVETGMKWIHWVTVDGIVDVTRDEAIEEAINIARRDGILVGLSSGAVAAGFKKVVEELGVDSGDFILVFPDHGFKYVEQFSEYLSTHEGG